MGQNWPALLEPEFDKGKSHWTISALDSSMILLNAVVEILAVPVSDIHAELASNCTRITVMPVRGVTRAGVTPVTALADRKNFSAAALHIAGLAQHHIHQSASAVNRSGTDSTIGH